MSIRAKFLIGQLTIAFILAIIALRFWIPASKEPSFTLEHQCIYATPMVTCNECYQEKKDQYPTCLTIVTSGDRELGTLCMLRCKGPADFK